MAKRRRKRKVVKRRRVSSRASAANPRAIEAAQKPEGQITEIRYLAKKPPPAEATPVAKVSLVRRIGQIGCGVGYYP